LELHPEKTKIVSGKDDKRWRTYPNEQFDFLHVPAAKIEESEGRVLHQLRPGSLG
jgi:hypothetical protein